MHRKKLPRGAVEKKAPDEAFITYAQTRARETEAELEKRLSNCDDILAAVHKTIPRLIGRYKQRSEMPYQNFDGQRVKDVLRTFLRPRSTLNKTLTSKLARRAKYWEAQGQDVDRQESLGKLYRSLPGRYSGKCPTRSTLITALATYLWQCQNIRAYLSVPERYKLIGSIITAAATPVCLLCEKKHRFKSWQAVMKLDQYRQERHPSQEEKEQALLDKTEADFSQAKAIWEQCHKVKLKRTFQEPWRSYQERLRKERTQAFLKGLPKNTKS